VTACPWPRAVRSFSSPSFLVNSAEPVSHHAYLSAGDEVLAPCTHDEGVIDRNTPDFVDSFRLERFEISDITRRVFGRTGRREGSPQPENGDLLALAVGDLELIRTDAAAFGVRFYEFVSVPSGRRSPVLMVCLVSRNVFTKG